MRTRQCKQCKTEMTLDHRCNKTFCNMSCKKQYHRDARLSKYNNNPSICKHCGKLIPYDKRFNQFCNCVCAAYYNNAKGYTRSDLEKESISKGVRESSKHKQHLINVRKLNHDKLVSWICPICNKELKLSPATAKGRTFCSKECYNKDHANDQKYCTIYRPGPTNRGGRNSHKGFYKSIWCDSTYELVWVIYNLDHNIPFTKCQESFPYIATDGRVHLYYPDFKISDDEYVELKNYLKPLDELKIKQFPKVLHVLFREQLKVHFNYVYETYGKDLKSLYDK